MGDLANCRLGGALECCETQGRVTQSARKRLAKDVSTGPGFGQLLSNSLAEVVALRPCEPCTTQPHGSLLNLSCLGFGYLRPRYQRPRDIRHQWKLEFQ